MVVEMPVVVAAGSSIGCSIYGGVVVVVVLVVLAAGGGICCRIGAGGVGLGSD